MLFVVLIVLCRAKALCTPGGGPSHVKMMVEWSQQLKSRLDLFADSVNMNVNAAYFVSELHV